MMSLRAWVPRFISRLMDHLHAPVSRQAVGFLPKARVSATVLASAASAVCAAAAAADG